MNDDPNLVTGSSTAPQTPAQTPAPAPAVAPAQAPQPPAPTQAPPAAQIVAQGQITEREAALQRTIRDRETRISELEDENHRLKTPATPAPKAEPAKKSFLDDWLP